MIIHKVDISEIQAAFDDVFDQAIVFHGFADYMRDYEVFVYATADPRTGVAPEHRRYRFKHCVRATAMTAISPATWKQSLDERLVDTVGTGHAPFVVSPGGPDFKVPLP